VSGGNLDELPRQLTELRELIRAAHEATKDLNRAIREAREYAAGLVTMVDAAADTARRAAHDAGVAQLNEYQAHIQSEMNRSAGELNKAIVAARAHISRAMMPKIASLDLADDGPGVLVVQFEGALFDADVPSGGY
jgi:uncharacterized protein Yka (UPF0111/DUF47 family)